MKRILLLLLCTALLGFAQPPQSRPNRHSVLRQLTTDLDTAMQRASLKDKDRKKLEIARGNLQTIGEVQKLERTDRADLKRYLKDVQKRTHTFQPDDRRAVEQDLRQAHDLGLDKGVPARTARAPRMPRYPRRWPY